MTIDDDSERPRHREADRAELGEMVWRGHGGRRPRVLAHGGCSTKSLALSADHVYWADDADGSITRLPKDGGVPLVLATEQVRPTALARHEGFLYWATTACGKPQGKIVRMPEDGGDIETIATGTTWPQAIAVSGQDVFWTDFGDGIAGWVMRGSVGGAAPVLLASKQKQPDAVVVDGQELFWINHGNKRPRYFMDGSVMRMRPDAGKKRWILAKAQSMPSSIALDETSIYWTTAATHDSPFALGGIFKRARTGGKATRLASLTWHGAALAVDATHVYCMADYEGPMFRVPKNGGDPEPLLSSVDAAYHATFISGFAMDERFLYWTATFSGQAGGAVWKMAK